jgi:phage-related protein
MEVKFYKKRSGREPVYEFLAEQSKEIRTGFLDAIESLADGEKLKMPLSRSLPGIYPGLHELRLKDRSGQFRFFYWIKIGEAVFFMHAFHKKTQELPRKEIDLVIRRIKEL